MSTFGVPINFFLLLLQLQNFLSHRVQLLFQPVLAVLRLAQVSGRKQRHCVRNKPSVKVQNALLMRVLTPSVRRAPSPAAGSSPARVSTERWPSPRRPEERRRHSHAWRSAAQE